MPTHLIIFEWPIVVAVTSKSAPVLVMVTEAFASVPIPSNVDSIKLMSMEPKVFVALKNIFSQSKEKQKTQPIFGGEIQAENAMILKHRLNLSLKLFTLSVPVFLK